MSGDFDEMIACPECGHLMDVSEKICESCGADVGAHRQQFLYLFVGACALALLFGGFIVWSESSSSFYDDDDSMYMTTGGGVYGVGGGSHRAGSRGATRRGASSGGFGFGK